MDTLKNKNKKPENEDDALGYPTIPVICTAHATLASKEKLGGEWRTPIASRPAD